MYGKDAIVDCTEIHHIVCNTFNNEDNNQNKTFNDLKEDNFKYNNTDQNYNTINNQTQVENSKLSRIMFYKKEPILLKENKEKENIKTKCTHKDQNSQILNNPITFTEPKEKNQSIMKSNEEFQKLLCLLEKMVEEINKFIVKSQNNQSKEKVKDEKQKYQNSVKEITIQIVNKDNINQDLFFSELIFYDFLKILFPNLNLLENNSDNENFSSLSNDNFFILEKFNSEKECLNKNSNILILNLSKKLKQIDPVESIMNFKGVIDFLENLTEFKIDNIEPEFIVLEKSVSKVIHLFQFFIDLIVILQEFNFKDFSLIEDENCQNKKSNTRYSSNYDNFGDNLEINRRLTTINENNVKSEHSTEENKNIKYEDYTNQINCTSKLLNSEFKEKINLNDFNEDNLHVKTDLNDCYKIKDKELLNCLRTSILESKFKDNKFDYLFSFGNNEQIHQEDKIKLNDNNQFIQVNDKDNEINYFDLHLYDESKKYKSDVIKIDKINECEKLILDEININSSTSNNILHNLSLFLQSQSSNSNIIKKLGNKEINTIKINIDEENYILTYDQIIKYLNPVNIKNDIDIFMNNTNLLMKFPKLNRLELENMIGQMILKIKISRFSRIMKKNQNKINNIYDRSYHNTSSNVNIFISNEFKTKNKKEILKSIKNFSSKLKHKTNFLKDKITSYKNKTKLFTILENIDETNVNMLVNFKYNDKIQNRNPIDLKVKPKKTNSFNDFLTDISKISKTIQKRFNVEKMNCLQSLNNKQEIIKEKLFKKESDVNHLSSILKNIRKPKVDIKLNKNHIKIRNNLKANQTYRYKDEQYLKYEKYSKYSKGKIKTNKNMNLTKGIKSKSKKKLIESSNINKHFNSNSYSNNNLINNSYLSNYHTNICKNESIFNEKTSNNENNCNLNGNLNNYGNISTGLAGLMIKNSIKGNNIYLKSESDSG